MNLVTDYINELGGYEVAKKKNTSWLLNHGENWRNVKDATLLEYRRQHNIFEVGDSFVNYADDAIYTALSIDQNNRMHGKSGDKNVWTYFGRFGLRHATDLEIKAGCKL